MTDQTAATKTRKAPAAKSPSKRKSSPRAKIAAESAAPQPTVKASPAPGPAPSVPGFMQELGPLLLSPENREAVERLSMNLARAALTAQGAITEAALRQVDKTPLSADPFNAGPAM